MVKILVCGGRDYKNHSHLTQVLSDAVAEYVSQGEEVIVIHGGASGADDMAGLWAKVNDFTVWEFPANWREHGRAAGPIRNSEMLTSGMPDIVIAFPGGRGTADMISKAEKAGVPVRQVVRI